MRNVLRFALLAGVLTFVGCEEQTPEPPNTLPNNVDPPMDAGNDLIEPDLDRPEPNAPVVPPTTPPRIGDVDPDPDLNPELRRPDPLVDPADVNDPDVVEEVGNGGTP